jgi:hypothetical protein
MKFLQQMKISSFLYLSNKLMTKAKAPSIVALKQFSNKFSPVSGDARQTKNCVRGEQRSSTKITS